MLLNMTIANFKSVKSPQTISFEAIKDNRLSESKVVKINEKLNSYLNEKLSNAQSYNTDQVSTIEACKVQDNGLYSMLVIAKNHEDIEKIINGYFS